MNIYFQYEAMVNSGEKIKGTFEGSKSEFEQMVAQKKLIVLSGSK